MRSSKCGSRSSSAEVRERGVGHALHAAHHLRDRLGLGTRGPLPQPLGSLALGPLALGHILELGDQLPHRAVPTGGGRHAQSHHQHAAIGMQAASLGAEHARFRPPARAGPAILGCARSGCTIDSHAAPGELRLRPAEHVGKRPVHLQEPPVEGYERHAARGIRERGAEALLALLERRRLLMQVDEHCHLRSQDGRVIGLQQVVDGALGVAAEHVLGVLADGGHEDDRHVARSLALLDQRRGLESVEPGHPARRAGSPRTRPSAAA